MFFDSCLFQSLTKHVFAFENIKSAMATTQNQSRAVHWCFTTNNYTDDHVSNLRSLGNSDICRYLIFGYETGENGTPHLQGYVAFTSRFRFSEVQSKIPDSHLSVTRQVQKSIQYCKKEENFEEFGDPPTGAGHRTDIENFKDSVKDGCIDMKKLRENFSETFAKYPRFCQDYVRDHLPTPTLEAHPLRDWQQTLNSDLLLVPDSRKIIFIVDYEGNKGKSWFSRYFCSIHSNAQLILPSKKADMAFVLQHDLRVLFVDAPRSKQGDFLQYDFLEDVKNGYVMSNKYESYVKTYNHVHVVVMMNERPDPSKLSRDRYDIREI